MNNSSVHSRLGAEGVVGGGEEGGGGACVQHDRLLCVAVAVLCRQYAADIGHVHLTHRSVVVWFD